jgi:hypothetical protein
MRRSGITRGLRYIVKSGNQGRMMPHDLSTNASLAGCRLF